MEKKVNLKKEFKRNGRTEGTAMFKILKYKSDGELRTTWDKVESFHPRAFISHDYYTCDIRSFIRFFKNKDCPTHQVKIFDSILSKEEFLNFFIFAANKIHEEKTSARLAAIDNEECLIVEGADITSKRYMLYEFTRDSNRLEEIRKERERLSFDSFYSSSDSEDYHGSVWYKNLDFKEQHFNEWKEKTKNV